MNTLVQDFRSKNPNYPASDDDITLQYGDLYPPDQYEYPADFISDYQRLKTQRDVAGSNMWQEAKSGFGRGVKGLESAAVGGVALAADYLGAEGLKKWGLDAYQRISKEAAENYPASVPTIQQAVTSPSALGQYVTGKVVEFIPAIGEAVVASMVGTAVAPGPGTAAGLGSIFVRGASKAAIKKLAESQIKKEVKDEVEGWLAGKVATEALTKDAAKFVARASGVRASTDVALANFAAIGAGGEYGALANTPGVSPADARTGALIAGAGSSLGAMIPAGILGEVFGDKVPPASYIDLFARKIPATLLKTGSVMGTMEFFNVLAEHYADPAKRDQDFSKEDWSKILNGFAAGVLMGAPESVAAGLRVGRKPGETETPPPPESPKTEPKPGPIAPDVGKPYATELGPAERATFITLAEKEIDGTLTQPQKDLIKSFPEGLRLAYEQIKTEVENASRLRAHAGQVPPGGDVTPGGKDKGGADLERGSSGKPGDTGAQKPTTETATGKADVSVTPIAQAAAALPEPAKAALEKAGADLKEITAPATPHLPEVGDTIIYQEGWPNPRTVTAKVVELRKNPVPGGEPLIPIVELPGGKIWPAVEWFETGKIVPKEQVAPTPELILRGGAATHWGVDEKISETQADVIVKAITGRPVTLSNGDVVSKTKTGFQVGTRHVSDREFIDWVDHFASADDVETLLHHAEPHPPENVPQETILPSDVTAAEPVKPAAETGVVADPVITKGSFDIRNQAVPEGWVWLKDEDLGGGADFGEIERYPVLTGFGKTKGSFHITESGAHFTKPSVSKPLLDGFIVKKTDARAVLEKSNRYWKKPDVLKQEHPELFGGIEVKPPAAVGSHRQVLFDRLIKEGLSSKDAFSLVAGDKTSRQVADEWIGERSKLGELEELTPGEFDVLVDETAKRFEAILRGTEPDFQPPATEPKTPEKVSKEEQSELKSELDEELGQKKPETPAPAAPPDTSWLSNVLTTDWRPLDTIEQETVMFKDLGRDKKDPGNKNKSNTLGIFRRKSDGKVIVATVYKNQGNKIYLGGKTGQDYKSALSEKGLEPVEFVRTDISRDRFYQEYSPEEWNAIRERKAEVGAITPEDAQRIYDQVLKHVGGMPNPEDTAEMVASAISKDRNLARRIWKLAGENPEHNLSILDQIYAAYERAAKSGETDPTKVREQVTKELGGIRPKEPEAKAGDGTNAPAPPTGTEPPAGPEREHLASDSIPRDRDSSPRGQSLVRDVLSKARNAYEALVELSRRGVYGDDPLVKELIALGDHGTRVSVNPPLQRKGVSGRYSQENHTAYLYDSAFTDGNAARTFLHEYVHGNTVYQMESGRHRGELTLLYERANEAAKAQGYNHYGLTNQQEFLAEAFTNPSFQGFLKSIKPIGLNETLWTRFLNWVGRLIGIKDPSLLDEVISVGQRISGKYEQPPIQIHPSSRTAPWHTPVTGTRETMESYSPATGKVELSSLVPDSVEAVLQNVNKPETPLEFLLPSSNGQTMPEVDKSVVYGNEHAKLNKVLEVLNRAVTDAGTTLHSAVKLFGLSNPQTAKEALANEESVHQIAGVNRNQTLESTTHLVNRDDIAVGALGALESNRTKVNERVTSAKTDIPAFETKHQTAVDEATETVKNLEDSTALSQIMSKGVERTIDDTVRAYGKDARQAGIAEQMYRDIEGKLDEPIDAAVVNVFRRLSKSDALQGERFFDMMDQLANDPGINFGDKASIIRAYIKEMAPNVHIYEKLAHDDPETKALLSTVIAYGKLHRKIMTMLQVRKMNGPDRVELKQEMMDMFKETTGQLKGGVRVAKATSALAERARAEHRESLRQVAETKRDLEHAQSVVYIGEKLLKHHKDEIDRITPLVQATEDTVFGDGMDIRIPKTNDANTDWDHLTLNLKVSSGNPTSVAQLKSAVDRMSIWMKLREAAFHNGDELALGYDYHRTKRQVEAIVKEKLADPVIRATDHTTVGLFMGSVAKQMGALGTPVGALIETGINKYAGDANNLRNQADREFGFKNQRLFNKVVSVLNKGQRWYQRAKVKGPWFESNILNAALGFLERGRPREGYDLKSEQDAWFEKMGDWLVRQETVGPLIADRMPQFMKAMRELADSLYSSGGWWVKKNTEEGMLVKDPSLGGKLRKHIDQGLWTFQRKFSPTFFAVVHALRESKWAPDEKTGEIGARKAWQNFAQVWSKDPASGEALVNKYVGHPTYGQTIWNHFIYKLAHTPDGSTFRTPALDDVGTKVAADPAKVAKACEESNGNLIDMLLRLHDVYNGQESRADYIQDELVHLAGVFHTLNSALEKVEPRDPTKVTTFVGMVPNAMIDARELKDLPPDWFQYHRFDNNDNARIAERTAWQINFGREGRELANWHATAKQEADSAVDLLRVVQKQASDATPSSRKSDIRKAMVRILANDPSPIIAGLKTGKERLKFLERQEKRYPMIQDFLTDMAAYHTRGTDAAGDLRWGIRLAGELSSLLVNQPGSAISQLATTVDIMAKWGLSPATLRATGRTIQMTSKDIAGSLAQGIGWEFLKPSYYEDRAFKAGLLSPLTARRMGDIYGTLTGEERNPGSKFWRVAKEAQGFTVNLKGESARYTPLQPFSPFFQFVSSANRGLLVSLAEMADGYVTKGLEFLRSNPGAENITAEDMGMKGWDKNTFEIWKKDHARYGLDFTEMVKGAKERAERGDKTVITDKELSRINAVALNVISLESNISTMPLWAFNNSVVRFGLPLLGWSYRRAGQVSGLRLNTKDQASLYAVMNGMLGIAAVGLGGLGISLMVDAYSEDLLGKKRNIRSLRVPTSSGDAQAIMERLNRVGTFGMWGELLNSAFNVGTGQGDNRMISVDQRVVAMQSFQSLFRAITNYVNQGADADYRNVVRPIVSALGGNGALQYAQIINHAFDLDNVESRVVKRINAENWLRVTGRDLGFSIRTGGGGYNTPTPITPWIARMEFAAYANSPEEFRAAYNIAKQEAKDSGKSDPADYVKKAYETRHPLRYVFAQVPSEREYRQILANMDDSGKESVEEAVRMFNHYGAYLGLTPFHGSVKKDQQRLNSAERIMNARLRAIGATP